MRTRSHRCHQNTRSNLVRGGATIPRKDLRALFLAIAAPLKCRPEPRWLWDDVARAEPRSPFPWEGLQAAIRGAIDAGATRADVVRFHTALLEEALDALTARDTAAEPTTVLALIREESEALEAQAVATAHPSQSNCARAVAETREAIAHGERYLAGLTERALELVR